MCRVSHSYRRIRWHNLLSDPWFGPRKFPARADRACWQTRSDVWHHPALVFLAVSRLTEKRNFCRCSVQFHHELLVHVPFASEINHVSEYFLSDYQILRVIGHINERHEILKAVHEGLGDSLESRALGAHIGRDKMVEKIKERYF